MRRGAPDWWVNVIGISCSLMILSLFALMITSPRKRGRPPIVGDDSILIPVSQVCLASSAVLVGSSVVAYQIMDGKIPISQDPLHPGIDSRSNPGLFWFAIVFQFVAVLTFGSMMLYTFLA